MLGTAFRAFLVVSSSLGSVESEKMYNEHKKSSYVAKKARLWGILVRFEYREYWIWPSITDPRSAAKAAKQGLWACAFCAGVTLMFLVLGTFSTVPRSFYTWSIIRFLFYVGIGWGIFRMNRPAAMAGLVLFAVDRLLAWPKHELAISGFVVYTLFGTLMFLNSIRGISAYYKYQKTQTEQGTT